MDIPGKRALVTGAAKRVGREIAIHLAKKGAHILLHYHHSKAEAEKTASEIRALGRECVLLPGDLNRVADIDDMVRRMEAGAKPVDILVNSASVFYKTPFCGVNESDWDTVVNSNLKGPFFLSKRVGCAMAKSAGGKIINIADWSGVRPYKDYAPYCVSKGGLLTLTKTLARDLAPKVQANSVAPGPVLPPPGMSAEEKESVTKKTLLGRWGSPMDIAYATAFLIENDFINGTVLVVDGGRSIS